MGHAHDSSGWSLGLGFSLGQRKRSTVKLCRAACEDERGGLEVFVEVRSISSRLDCELKMARPWRFTQA